MDYCGGGGGGGERGQRVCWPLLKIIRGGGKGPGPTSSYAYDMSGKSSAVDFHGLFHCISRLQVVIISL